MKKILLFVTFMLSFLIVIFPADAMQSAKEALLLCQNTLIPSLFPFMVCSNLLLSLGGEAVLAKAAKNIMMPLFKIRGEGSVSLILGLLSGYPCGAITACTLYKNGSLSKSEAHRLLSFANNSGPLFIISAVGIGIYQNTKIGVLLYVSHLLSALTAGIMAGFFHRGGHEQLPTSHLPKKSPSKALSESIISCLNVCGYVIFFAVLYKMLQKCRIIAAFEKLLCLAGFRKELSRLLSCGIFEITTAIKMSLCTNLGAVAAVISMGGMSVLLQTMSFTRAAGLSIKPYIMGKIFAGGFSAFYMSLLMKIFPVEISVFSPLTKAKLLEYPPYLIAFFTSVFCFIFYFILLSLPQDGKSACPEKQNFAHTRS